MFQLISSDKLVIGKKYGIVSEGNDYSGIYKGPITVFNKECIVFDTIYDTIEEVHFKCPFYFTKYDLYYVFVSECPQWNMERRSVNLIVRRLIGDDCFEW
jgi:hypothetical protein